MLRSGARLTVALVCALMAGAPSARADADGEAVIRFGLVGAWAVDCSAPPAPQNPYQIYATSNGDRPTRELRMQVESLDGIFEMLRARLLGPNRLAYTDSRRGGGQYTFDIIVEIEGGRMRSIQSVRSDGATLIRDGKFSDSGRGTLVFQKCEATSTGR
ncbi:MAG: hypothetical protein KDJ41_00745 [Hyphomicrobiaceae bacterium]|nr:hypothetical protein [Hyphomicrobiaceae bacterium]